MDNGIYSYKNRLKAKFEIMYFSLFDRCKESTYDL